MTPSGEARLVNLLGAAATGLADAIADATLAASELDAVAATALIALLDFTPSGSVHALSQVVGLTHSGAVRLVDRLAGIGYVERSPGRDGRSITVQLTPDGRAAARRTRTARRRALMQPIDGLTEDQRDSLTELCEHLIAELTRERLRQRAAGATPTSGALCRMCDFGACQRSRDACPAAATAQQALDASR